MFGSGFVSLLLACLGDEATHLGVVFRAVGRVEFDQATRHWLLI
jgi:hypothetical protein